MKALQLTGYDDAPVVRDIEPPSPGPGEVLVRVAGAALNPLDVKIAAGHVRDYFPVTFPITVGTDVSGTVERLGPNVTGWAVGDPVVARIDPTVGGAVAELAVVPADALAPAPSTLPIESAAGLATAAAAAWQVVTEVAAVRAGQTVLVHGAAGGVGGFVVQFARRAGARVLATASPGGFDLVRKLGADEVVDYTAADFRATVAEVDVVVDPIGGGVEVASLDALRPGGLLVALNTPPDADRAVGRGLRAEFVFHSSDSRRLAKVVHAVDEGLELVVDRVVGLDGAAEAFAYVAAGHAKGKVLVVPGA